MLLGLLLLPFAAAFLMPLLHKILKDKVGWAALLVPLAAFVGFLRLLPVVNAGGDVSSVVHWIPNLGIDLAVRLDGLSLLFVLLISGIGTAVMLYSIFYLHHDERLANFYTFIMLFMGAMLGVCTSTNLVCMYLFWELTSVSSFLLIGFWYEKENPRLGAQKALLVTMAGGLCILAGILLLRSVGGSFAIDELLAASDTIKASSLYPAIVILLLIGAFAKSAQVPLHIWLPTAMEAPTPISCYLHSATMVKAGIYLIARMTPIIGGTAMWGGIVTIVGLTSLTFGSLMAIRQFDMKAILAYSTISQLGLIISLLGFGTKAAIAGALFHLLNHSAFKGSLFLMTGIVDHQTGTRDVRLLKGLSKVMPVSALVACIGAFSMAGLPPFSGFLSKEMFMEAAAEAHASNLAFLGDIGYLIPFVAVLASIFTFVYSVALFFKIFMGKELTKTTPKAPKEGCWGMLIPALCLVSLNLIIAVIPNKFVHWLIGGAIFSVTRTSYELHVAFWHGVTPAFIMTCIVVLLGLGVYFNYDWVKNLFLSYKCRFGAEKAYQEFLHGVPTVAGKFTNWHINGRLTDSMACTFGGALIFILGSMIYFNAWSHIDISDMAPVDVLDITLAIVATLAALGVATFKRRIWSILALSVVGFCVSFYFVIMRAPDLALTQLMVETISTVLYLLVLYKLPYGMIPDNPPTPNGRRTINALIGVLVGLMAFTVTIIGQGCKYFETIAWFYNENSLKLAGGNNIVNVTLVDFRGFDTMGEITVLSLAAIGVYIMIKLNRQHLYDRHGVEREQEAAVFNDSGNDTVVIEVDPYFQDEDDYKFPISPL